MKITHNKVGQNVNLTDASRAEKAGKAGQSAPQDKAAALMDSELGTASKVNVSTRAQDMKKIRDIANSTPDVDEAKVARLQKLIDNGEYKVDAKDIADKMVDEQIAW